MTKYVGAKQRSERTQLQRAVLAMLTTGMMAWPSFSPVYAANSVITDSNAQSLINASDTTHNIYAQTQVNAAVGANKFTQFKVAQNEVANLHFTRQSMNDNFHTLLNFVDARIEVNGTVNALRNNRIGGNLYFISSNGMIVGQSGAINAGALTVTVPQSAYLTGIMTGSLEGAGKAFLKDTIANSVPLNPSGSIVVNGKIRTGLEAKFNAANIVVGKDLELEDDGSPKHNDDGSLKVSGDYGARIYTGVYFGDIVNISADFDTEFEGGQHRLQITKVEKDVVKGTEEDYYVLDAVQGMKGDGTKSEHGNTDRKEIFQVAGR